LSFLAEIFSNIFTLLIALVLLAVVCIYIIDVTQTKQTVRRNFPVIGRFRYWFEHLGEFFRQYFFAMDREELPFNRAQRSWVYRAAKNVNRNLGFGSTRDIYKPGTIIFSNASFPPMAEDSTHASSIIFGPNCEHPYKTDSYFNISAMSYGALSKVAIKALSRGAKLSGCWLNTGEGGLSPYHLEGGADVVFQMGTAKYGVRNSDGSLNEDKLKKLASHQQVKMIEIKLSQGAKPGKGGILPADKVTEEIALIRGIPVGEDSISPNRHVEISNTEELLNFVKRVREVSGKPTGIKFVLGDPRWIQELCLSIKKLGKDFAPDFITLDSSDGGTAAAPQPLFDYVGMPICESLPILIDALVVHGLKPRIRVIASGKLITPSKVAWALALGADAVNSARGFMFALGCIQSMQCHKNTCPTGITTHNPKLQRGLVPEDKAHRVYHYHKYMLYGVNMISHACGVKNPRELSRKHVRIVGDLGKSTPLDEMYPDP